MVVTLVLSGVSSRVNLYELASHLNNILITNEIGTCRMRTLPHHYKNNKRQIGLDFESGFEAMPAQDLLNGYEYETSDGTIHKIQAKISSTESAMAHSLDNLEDFERETYEFSMSDLLKRPSGHSSLEKNIRSRRKTSMRKYEQGSDSEDDRRRKHRHSPEPSRSSVKKHVMNESEQRLRYESPSPSLPKKKKLKKSKKSSKLKNDKLEIKQKAEKKLEKLKKLEKQRKKEKKMKMSSKASLERSSDESDIELQRHRKRTKKKRKSAHDYNSDVDRDHKYLKKYIKKLEKLKSKETESSQCKETDLLRDKLNLEVIKTDNNKIVETKSDGTYVWSDDSCETNIETSKHVISKNSNNQEAPSHICPNLTDTLSTPKNLEKRLESLQRHNSIGKSTNVSLQDSSLGNIEHKTNKLESETLSNFSDKKSHRKQDLSQKVHDRIHSKGSYEPFNSMAKDSNINTLTYEYFDKATQSIVIKSEPKDELENEDVDSNPQFSTMIKSEPMEDNEKTHSEILFNAKSLVIKSEPIDELDDGELPFSTKSKVIKSEPSKEFENEELNLESDINQDSKVNISNVDYDSESTLELEVNNIPPNDCIPYSNQEDSEEVLKSKEDDHKIWDVIDEVLQDIPLDIF